MANVYTHGGTRSRSSVTRIHGDRDVGGEGRAEGTWEPSATLRLRFLRGPTGAAASSCICLHSCSTLSPCLEEAFISKVPKTFPGKVPLHIRVRLFACAICFPTQRADTLGSPGVHTADIGTPFPPLSLRCVSLAPLVSWRRKDLLELCTQAPSDFLFPVFQCIFKW